MSVDGGNAAGGYELETLVVKLLRAYGECLGARSR
jgi:hypothetical protein